MTTVVYEEITSLADIDFDLLFQQSFDRLDANFLWPSPLVTYDQKKEYYYNQLTSAINGTWELKSPTEVFKMYRTIVDGQIAEFVAGYVDNGDTYGGRWYLTAPTPDGSRNWMYTPEAQAARKVFFTDNGLVNIKYYTFVNSDLYRLVKMRATNGGITLLDEYPTVAGDNPHNLVTLVIQF